MSLLDDVSDILTTGGLTAATIVKSFVPSTPDDVVAIFETGGPAPVHGMARGPASALLERPHVQILSRAGRADTAKKNIQDANRLLDGLDLTINNVRYHGIYALQSPFFMERDNSGRVTYAVNFEVLKAPASSS